MALTIAKKGIPIARYDKDEFIRYTEQPHEGEMDLEKIADIVERWMKHFNTTIDVKKLKQYLLNDEEPPKKEKKMRKIWRQIVDELNNRCVVIKDGSFLPCFDSKNPEKDRKVFYIAGMSGSGKSTFASKLIDDYIKQYPRGRLWLFSNKDADPALDKHKKLVRIQLDESLVDEPLNLEELRNSLIIYDDVEFTKNKALDRELERVRDLILQQGRSFGIQMIYIVHQLSNYKSSRIILNECHSITVFPSHVNRNQLDRVLTLYFGLSKEDIDRIEDMKSRAVTINKFPKCVIGEKEIFLTK